MQKNNKLSYEDLLPYFSYKLQLININGGIDAGIYTLTGINISSDTTINVTDQSGDEFKEMYIENYYPILKCDIKDEFDNIYDHKNLVLGGKALCYDTVQAIIK